MFTLNCKGRLLSVDKPLVMGIINITPDSFYSGSRAENTDAILQRTEQMIHDGVSIIDIGGQSTRPGSEKQTAETELNRVTGVIHAIHSRFPELIISIDSFYAKVVASSVEAGASIVNDISCGMLDENMISTVARLQVPYVCMHMKGTPQNMHHNPVYDDLTREVLDFFIWQVDRLHQAGIQDIIIDPGFGFGKTSTHNFELLRNLSVFKMLNCPILAGLSRKSTISQTLGITTEDALNGTTVLQTIALMHGADILRVHDVKEAVETTRLFRACFPHAEKPPA